MNAASQVPSGVFTVTSVSTTASAAAKDWPVAATSPAATERAMKSRRETFSVCAFSGSCLSIVISWPPATDGNYVAFASGLRICIAECRCGDRRAGLNSVRVRAKLVAALACARQTPAMKQRIEFLNEPIYDDPAQFAAQRTDAGASGAEGGN